jgi:hypothetical protein
MDADRPTDWMGVGGADRKVDRMLSVDRTLGADRNADRVLGDDRTAGRMLCADQKQAAGFRAKMATADLQCWFSGDC